MMVSESFGVGAGEPGLVSVVVPSYQSAAWLGRAIDSVLAQTHSQIDLIVVDDGSTDDTRDLVAGYGPRVRYYYQENAGVAAARNRGLLEARGEYIALLDADDFWQPWKLVAQVAVLRKHSEVGMVWTEMAAIDDVATVRASRYLRNYYDAYQKFDVEHAFSTFGTLAQTCPGVPAQHRDDKYHLGDVAASMMWGNLIPTSSVVLRRERLRAVGGFDTSFEVSGEDYDFHLRTCLCGPVAFIDAPSVVCRIGTTDPLASPRSSRYRALNNLRTFERGLSRAGARTLMSPSDVKRRLADSHRWLGLEELRSGNRNEARRQFAASLAYRPLWPSTSALWLLALMPESMTRGLSGGRGGDQPLR